MNLDVLQEHVSLPVLMWNMRRYDVHVVSVLHYDDTVYFLFVRQDQLQQKIVCPGVVTCLSASPDGLFLAAGVAEAVYLWEVSELFLLIGLSMKRQVN